MTNFLVLTMQSVVTGARCRLKRSDSQSISAYADATYRLYTPTRSNIAT